MKTVFQLLIVLMIGSSYAQSNLPKCQGNSWARWNNCYGTIIKDNGHQYVGEWKNGKLNGQGILYGLNDSVINQGIWKDDKLISSGPNMDPANVSGFLSCTILNNGVINLSIPFFFKMSDYQSELWRMAPIQRKPTEMERQALDDYIKGLNQCSDKYFYIREKGLLLDLRDAKITFADYAVANRKGTDLFLQNLDNKIRNSEKTISLSCIVEADKMGNIELQVQFNEEHNLIWTHQGKSLSNFKIGQTEVRFHLADMEMVISRNTGRFRIGTGSPIFTGTCQTIAQRKF